MKNSHSSYFFILVSIVIIIFSSFLYLQFTQDFETISPSLKIYNWEDYTGTPELLQEFEKIYGTKIEIEIYEDENEILDKNISDYDLIMMSESFLKKYTKSKSLEKIRPKIVTNLKNLDSECMIKSTNSKYFVPYTWGTSGVIVNENYISDHRYSWDVLWDKKYSNRITMLNNIEELIIAASFDTKSQIFPKTQMELETIKDFLKFQKSGVYKYVSNPIDMYDELANGTIWAAHAYSSDYQYFTNIDSLKYYIPTEGAAIWIDGFVIPKNSPNQYTAELFLNFLLEKNNNLNISLEYEFPPCNKYSKELLPQYLLNDTSIFVDNKTRQRLYFLADFDLPEKFNSQMDDFYKKLVE